jgi:hypothetical protein
VDYRAQPGVRERYTNDELKNAGTIAGGQFDPVSANYIGVYGGQWKYRYWHWTQDHPFAHTSIIPWAPRDPAVALKAVVDRDPYLQKLDYSQALGDLQQFWKLHNLTERG